MSRNPDNCPHNVVDYEDGEEYCTECGVVTVPRSECCGAQIDDFGYCKECREHAI